MRVLFVSSTTVGGSGRSQRELAHQLICRGHRVEFLVDDGRRAAVTRWAYGQASDLSVRGAGTRAARLSAWLRGGWGRRTGTVCIEGLRHEVTPIPQNALPGALARHRPEVVVVNSVERWAWRMIRETCSEHQVPVILYVREDDSLRHLDTGAHPTVLVANAQSLAERLQEQGFDCAFVPSVVDVAVTATESSRQTVLAINPAPSRGGDLVWMLAEALPDIPFVIQESWPLSGEELDHVRDHVRRLGNVEFRRTSPPGPSLYADARVLLVPYRVDNRPRVILEAQANGIPVIAGDVPALVEAVGPGGLVVPLDSVEAWVAAIRSLWTDDGPYESLAEQAWTHGHRPQVDPGAVTGRFEDILRRAVGEGKRGGQRT